MVIRGKSRSNPRQLSHYLLEQKDNEAIRILDINGQIDPQAEDLHRAVYLMGISAELSRGDKGLYHAQINPAIGEDKLMDNDQWLQAADILGRQLGLANQSRAIVLHTKKGRTHAHVVWERFDHNKGKMVSDSFSRLAQDRARKEMELVFVQRQTPHRNKHRPELKASLTEIWQKTDTGAKFIREAKRYGYIISTGSGRSPFMVVDENGRSYDLTRQLKDVRLKEVRQRLRNEILIGENEAIELARKKDNTKQGGKQAGEQQLMFDMKRKVLSGMFNNSRADLTNNDASDISKKPKTEFSEKTDGVTGKEPMKKINDKTARFNENEISVAMTNEKNLQKTFEQNKDDIEKEMEKKRKLLAEEILRRAKNKEKGRSL